MVLQRHMRAMAVLLLSMGPGVGRLAAQRVGVGLVVGSTDAVKFEHVVGATSYVQLRSVPFRLQLQFLNRSHEGNGVACGGFVPPGTCGSERIRDRTQSWGGGVGWLFTVAERGHWQAGVPVDVMASVLRGATHGLESGRRIEADGSFLEFGLGAELMFVPAVDGPWNLRVRGSRRGGLSLNNEQCDDCYAPYQEGFGSWLFVVSLEHAWR